MSDSSQGAGHGSPSADEQSPLLGNGKTGPDHGSIERGQENDGGQEDSEDEVPIAEEPSTAKLLLVLGSIWIGCFLAALGLPQITMTQSNAILTNCSRFYNNCYTLRTDIVIFRLAVSSFMARIRLPYCQRRHPTSQRPSDRHPL